MSQSPLALKRPRGFFAAGRELDEALTLLSDGAFKLFVHLCLHAERRSGRLRFRLADLARRLGKSPRSITSYLAELQRQDVCTVQAAVNQHHAGLIEIRDRFWPYHKQAETVLDAQTGYVDRVRKLFLSRACVAGAFTAADERLVAEWRQCGVPLEQVERAYLLGCARKYVALLNNPGAPLISSLRYFTALLKEVAESPSSPGYWAAPGPSGRATRTPLEHPPRRGIANWSRKLCAGRCSPNRPKTRRNEMMMTPPLDRCRSPRKS